MQIPVAIEPTGTGQFRAQGLPPFTAFAEGRTSDEAISKLRDELQKEIDCGKQIVVVELPPKQENPWLAMAGWLKDDPMYDDWRVAMEEYRRECDNETGIDINDRS
jgi:hypothetical protein